jgi:hypothetical protein
MWEFRSPRSPAAGSAKIHPQARTGAPCLPPAYMGRKRWAKPLHCLFYRTDYQVNHLVQSTRWRGLAAAAYAEVVMGHKQSTQTGLTSQFGLLALLFALLLTQAASSVCGAQCVEHQLPNSPAAHAMNHCRSMMNTPSSTDGATLQTCRPCAHSYCAVDLLANSHAKTEVLVSSTTPTGTLLRLQDESSAPALLPLRSSPGSSPPITALRL